MSSQEIQEFAGLLENSFTLGYLSELPRRSLSNGAALPDAKPPAWNGMFFVYDRTGKEALLSKAMLRLRAEEKEAPRLSQMTIGGVPVLKAEGKNGATYWAEHGKYAVSAGERSVMEEILGRIDGKVSGAASLAQSAAYQEAQANLGSGLLEFFVRIPDLKNLAAESKAAPSRSGRSSTPPGSTRCTRSAATSRSKARKRTCRPRSWAMPFPERPSTSGPPDSPRPHLFLS